MIASTEEVRNLGVVVFDSEMNMCAHIAKTAQTCFYHLRRLRQIRRLMGHDVACTVVTALVLSRLDYCNAVLSGLPQSTIALLQQVLNAAARVVCDLRPRDHVTDALIGLHWLPVALAARIEFKLCLLVYQARNGLASYITDMLQPVSTLDRQVTLRSVDNNDLFVLRLGERAFYVAAPRAWNSLPSDTKKADTVKTFKKTTKDFPVLQTLWRHLISFIVLYFYVSSWSAYVVSCLVQL